MHIEDGSTFVDSPTQGKYLQIRFSSKTDASSSCGLPPTAYAGSPSRVRAGSRVVGGNTIASRRMRVSGAERLASIISLSRAGR